MADASLRSQFDALLTAFKEYNSVLSRLSGKLAQEVMSLKARAQANKVTLPAKVVALLISTATECFAARRAVDVIHHKFCEQVAFFEASLNDVPRRYDVDVASRDYLQRLHNSSKRAGRLFSHYLRHAVHVRQNVHTDAQADSVNQGRAAGAAFLASCAVGPVPGPAVVGAAAVAVGGAAAAVLVNELAVDLGKAGVIGAVVAAFAFAVVAVVEHVWWRPRQQENARKRSQTVWHMVSTAEQLMPAEHITSLVRAKEAIAALLDALLKTPEVLDHLGERFVLATDLPECPVCQEDIKDGSEIIVNAAANANDEACFRLHMAHRTCGEQWLRSRGGRPTCMTCRRNVARTKVMTLRYDHNA